MSCGQPPQVLGNPQDQAYGVASVDAIISNYKKNSSINQIRKECPNPKLYSSPDNRYTNKVSKSQNATEPDGISLTIIKWSPDTTDKHLTSIINTDLECSCFPKYAKIASVKRLSKKESRSDKSNYIPISILNGF